MSQGGKGGSTAPMTGSLPSPSAAPAVQNPIAPPTVQNPVPAPSAAAGPQGYGVNPNINAAQGMQQAFNTTQQGLDDYQAFAMGGGGTYNPAMQQGPQTLASQMQRYQNPYESQVIQNTMNDMNRNLQMQQSQTAADAARAGAFGGARHGLVEAENMAQTNRAMGDIAAQMRQQGFNTAAQFGGQDIANRMNVNAMNQAAQNQARQFSAGQTGNIMSNLMNARLGAGQQFGNLAGQSFGMGNQIAQNQLGAGGMAQQLQQQLFGQGQNMFNQWANQPQNILQMRLASLGMNPLNQATTTTNVSNPGWGTMFGNLLGAAGNSISFAPIQWPSSARFKEDILPTGEVARSVSGKEVPVVTFRYRNSPVTLRGVIAEDLGPNDPATVTDNNGQPIAVDYSKLEVVQ